MRPSSTPLPSLDALKDQARRLRARFSAEGQDISHSRALELIAAQYGFRDWNTLHAAVGNRRPFDAEVLGVQAVTSQPGRYRMTLHFDEPVDVVTFESFSAFRHRVTCTVDETGRTTEKTSNGRPHLELEW